MEALEISKLSLLTVSLRAAADNGFGKRSLYFRGHKFGSFPQYGVAEAFPRRRLGQLFTQASAAIVCGLTPPVADGGRHTELFTCFCLIFQVIIELISSSVFTKSKGHWLKALQRSIYTEQKKLKHYKCFSGHFCSMFTWEDKSGNVFQKRNYNIKKCSEKLTVSSSPYHMNQDISRYLLLLQTLTITITV